MLGYFLPDNLSITSGACLWHLILILCACFRSRNDLLQCHGERCEFNQHWRRSKHDTVWMKSKLLYEKSFNKYPPCRNETRPCIRRLISLQIETVVVPVRKLWICWVVTVAQKYKFLFVYKVASISVCDSSSCFSEVSHFSLNNSSRQKIKTNFRNGEKSCLSRINVVFTASRKSKFLQDDDAGL